jgi:hypothetical protein
VRVAGWMCVAAFAGCALPPVDPFARGAWSLQRQDLTAALQSFHQVPASHREAIAASQTAANIEIEMRWCHEQLALAIGQRAAGSDHAALATLHKVQERWPKAPGLVPLLRATAARLAASEVPAPTTVGTMAAAPVAVAAPPTAQLIQASSEPTAVPSAPMTEPALSAPSASIVTPIVVNEELTQRLMDSEQRLQRGDREGALAELHELARRYPHEARVRVRLARLVHQRALVRYGDGRLEPAIADWRQVLLLDPEHAEAQACLRGAERELALR